MDDTRPYPPLRMVVAVGGAPTNSAQDQLIPSEAGRATALTTWVSVKDRQLVESSAPSARALPFGCFIGDRQMKYLRRSLQR
jgi:hypothetical protein